MDGIQKQRTQRHTSSVHAVSGSAFAQLIECSLESAREFFRRASAPAVKEDHHGPVACHVVVNRNNIEAILRMSFSGGAVGRIPVSAYDIVTANDAGKSIPFHPFEDLSCGA